MSHTLHTPGPWKVYEHGSMMTSWHREIRDSDLGLVATVGNSNPDYPTEANARLIAAAPELVARVEARAARCLCHVAGADGTCPDCQADRAALARAKGE